MKDLNNHVVYYQQLFELVQGRSLPHTTYN